MACLRQRHAMLEDTDREAADEVDEDDNEARDGVALHEFHRAVHAAEELALLVELAAPSTRLLLRDVAGPVVAVDRHLLAGHGVEGEAGGDLGDALRPLRDDDELHGRNDEEEDEADEDVAAHHELAEALDDMAGIARGEDQAGR